MAQWHGWGGHTGLTHWTKIAAAEDSLRIAVAAFRKADSSSAKAKAKAVRRLAGRVLRLRVKGLKAYRERSVVDKSSAYAEERKQPEVTALAAGVDGILAEFGAKDAG